MLLFRACQDRDTGAPKTPFQTPQSLQDVSEVDLTFATVPLQLLLANVKSKTSLKIHIC
jgi:hypothetical protein